MTDLLEIRLTSKEMIEAEDANILHTENALTDALEDLGSGVIEGARFLKHLVTLDLTKYFESLHHSEILRDVVLARRWVINNYKEIDIELVGEEVVHVPKGFNVPQKLYIKIVEEHLINFKDTTNALLEDFNVELGRIISSEKYRKGGESVKELVAIRSRGISANEELVKSVDDLILSTNGGDSVAKVNKLIGDKEQLRDTLNKTFIIMKDVDELELKAILTNVSNLSKRIDIYEQLEEKGEIHKDVSAVFDDLVVYLANLVTVTSKLYNILYTSAGVQVNVVNNFIK